MWNRTKEKIQKSFQQDRAYAIKKCLSILLLLICIGFVFGNLDKYYSTHRKADVIENETEEDQGLISVESNAIVEQTFTGWDGELTEINIRFSNSGRLSSSGTVTVNVLNLKGKLLQSSVKNAEDIIPNKASVFAFDAPATLDEKQTYILQIDMEDIENANGFGVYTYKKVNDVFGELTANGTPVDGRLRASFIYTYYNTQAILDMFFMLFAAFVFVCFPFSRLDHLIRGLLEKGNRSYNIDTNRLMTRIWFFMTPILCIFMSDRINGYHLSEMPGRLFTWQGLFNWMIYTTVCLVGYAIVNRIQYACMITVLLAFVLDLTNYYVWMFRGCPILASDVQSIKTAANVAANFSYSLDLTGVWACVYLICFLSMLLSLRGYRGLRWKKRCVAAAGAVAAVALCQMIFFQSTIVQDHSIRLKFWNPSATYAKNGNALSFVLSWAAIHVNEPDGYSVEKITKLMSEYETETGEDTAGENTIKPNIIAIMDESLGDLNYDATFSTSEDYLPYLHGLTENTVKGQLYVSIEGSNTANSEFEFLTGYSMKFLPYRSVPYSVFINDTMPSLTWNLESQGYTGCNAYHPYLSSGWNREEVYPLLGFHEFRDIDYFVSQGNETYVRNYISDEADFNQIIADYEASREETDDPFYLFNVTMQNHGSYRTEHGTVETEITINDPALKYPEAEEYINLAKKTDDAFQMLTEYFEQVDEPTLIVMFGDHQPPLSNSFYSALFGTDVASLSKEEMANWYSTPYVIWANYDIPEEETDMSANYLSSYVMNLAGLQLSGYNKYLLELQKQLPVITAVSYQDANGTIYDNDEESPYDELLTMYQIIQYNAMFDIDNRVDEFFFLDSSESTGGNE